MSFSATSVEIATRGEKSVIVRFTESDGIPKIWKLRYHRWVVASRMGLPVVPNGKGVALVQSLRLSGQVTPPHLNTFDVGSMQTFSRSTDRIETNLCV